MALTMTFVFCFGGGVTSSPMTSLTSLLPPERFYSTAPPPVFAGFSSPSARPHSCWLTALSVIFCPSGSSRFLPRLGSEWALAEGGFSSAEKTLKHSHMVCNTNAERGRLLTETCFLQEQQCLLKVFLQSTQEFTSCSAWCPRLEKQHAEIRPNVTNMGVKRKAVIRLFKRRLEFSL